MKWGRYADHLFLPHDVTVQSTVAAVAPLVVYLVFIRIIDHLIIIMRTMRSRMQLYSYYCGIVVGMHIGLVE